MESQSLAMAELSITGHGRTKITTASFRLLTNAYQSNGFCIGGCGLEPDRMRRCFRDNVECRRRLSSIYSTFYGGGPAIVIVSVASMSANAIAVDSSNRIYITGQTASNSCQPNMLFSGHVIRKARARTLSSPCSIHLPPAATRRCSMRVITVATATTSARHRGRLTIAMLTSSAALHRRIWRRRARQRFSSASYFSGRRLRWFRGQDRHRSRRQRFVDLQHVLRWQHQRSCRVGRG